ncbi:MULTISPECIES: glycosyltransferase family 4 protein [unclassified Exiguobacterium]|uniref:glycosyltransferase family 4 protein n=1 Tax=unclassified Exiguobacterium TaxID=2644629 RepID=UPI001376145E|nr:MULTISPECIES: glycosyltransferase family 4 protein [unclassified Exiguobacterium]
MKIIIGTSSNFEIGGVNSYMNTLNDSLIKQGLESELLFPNQTTSIWKMRSLIKSYGNRDKARCELVELRKGNIEKKLRNKIENSSLKNEKILVHAQDIIFANTIKNNDFPLILTVHGPTSREAVMSNKSGELYSKYLIENERQAFKKADHIIAVDTGQKNIVIEDFGISPDKISVILNSVDVEVFKPKKVLENKKNIFLVPRRLVPKNGVDVAIKAFENLKNNECELWIAGDGPEKEKLKQMVCDMQLDDHVKFLGTVKTEEMVNLINQSTGVIIPSVPVNGVVEASSISALEGMSVGKPVIASDIGGLSELISHEENGLLFKSGEAKELANLVLKTIEDTTLREKLSYMARKVVIEQFSSEIWVKKKMEIYEQALSKYYI